MSLILQGVSYQHNDGTILFNQLDSTINTGEHVNLIGANGSGKTTLLQIMAGNIQPSGGKVIVTDVPFYMPQNVISDTGATVAEVMNAAEQISALHKILSGRTGPELFEQLQDEWDIEERAKAALDKWTGGRIMLDQRINEISGGELTRCILAGIELRKPSILLLDEPTNHLDVEGRRLLHLFLESYKGTMVVVSHDRALLERGSTTIVLADGRLETYGGNYSFYRASRDETVAARKRELHDAQKSLKRAKQLAQRTHERRERQRSRDKNDKQRGIPKILANRRRDGAEESAARLNDIHHKKVIASAETVVTKRDQLRQQTPLRVHLLNSQIHKGKLLLEAVCINHQFDGKSLWPQPLSFEIRSGDRMAVTGANGTGKSTLMKILVGDLVPSEGLVRASDCGRVYLDQHYSFVDEQISVLEQLETFNRSAIAANQLRLLLHQYHLKEILWDKKCAVLSGGEKLKLVLCCLSVANARPDLIILDEPTNNIDIESLEILSHALKHYEGTLILATHDTTFIDDVGVNRSVNL